ncbi:MAG: hypothetical protein K2I82_01280 [Ruminococcus sp.]|nr:hypothetical protein [Ruminococcus sp.]
MNIDKNTTVSESEQENNVQTVSDEEVSAISKKIIERNCAVYEELAK